MTVYGNYDVIAFKSCIQIFTVHIYTLCLCPCDPRAFHILLGFIFCTYATQQGRRNRGARGGIMVRSPHIFWKMGQPYLNQWGGGRLSPPQYTTQPHPPGFQTFLRPCRQNMIYVLHFLYPDCRPIVWSRVLYRQNSFI